MMMSWAAACALAACGGGSDSGSPTPAPTRSITLSGTAAEGALVVGKPVTVKCVSGSASTVTGADGTYSVVVPAAAWPCMAEVTTASGEALTTIAMASGATGIANLTPATHLVVATLLGTEPLAYFEAFDETLVAAITGDAIVAAQRKTIATLASAGVDFSAIGDLLASAFTAAYDTVLDTLSTHIAASGSTLGSLTTSIVAASAPSSISVAASLLLQPAATTCHALRSTTYRILTPTNGASLAAQSSLMTLDAPSLAVAADGRPAGTWIANGPCRFTEHAGSYNADVAVTPAGVLVARYTSDGVTFRSYVGFPEQAHALSELAGTWNVMGMSRISSTTYAGTAGTLTYDGKGAVTAATNCQNNATWAIDACTALGGTLLTGIVPLAADSAGGFDLTDPNTHAVTGRMFAFAPGSGDLMLASVDDKGELFLQAAIKSVSLPSVGLSTSSRNADNLESFLSASPIYVTSTTVTSVDSKAGSWSRSRLLSNGATRPETLLADNPRTGFTHRVGGTVSDSNGAASVVNEFTAMSVPGTGLSPLFLTSGTKLFELAARLP